MKHTQGQWIHNGYANGHRFIQNEQGNEIALVYQPIHDVTGYPTKEESLANAKLIAAAPVILDELQCTERYLDFVSESLKWLENNYKTGNAKQWILNQREMLNARKKCNESIIKKATEETTNELHPLFKDIVNTVFK